MKYRFFTLPVWRVVGIVVIFVVTRTLWSASPLAQPATTYACNGQNLTAGAIAM